MASRGRGKRQIARYLPWVLLFIPALAIPAIVIWLTADSGWMALCQARLPYFDLAEYRCAQVRMAIWALAAFGAFGVSVLLWWIFTELTGLTRIFEVPWFGVGDDVESVGVMESVVRAAIFVLFFWLCLGMSVLALIGAVPLWPASPGNSGGMQGALSKPGGSGSSPATPTSETPPAAAERKLDAAILEQIRQINNGIVGINKLLTGLDQKLVIPEPIQRKIGDWDPKAGAQLASTAALILKDTGSLTGTLGEIKKQTEDLNKISAGVKQDIGILNATVIDIKNQLIKQDQQLAFLQLIYATLGQKGRDVPSENCFDVVAEAKSRSDATASEPASPEPPKERVRIVAAGSVFFDKGEYKLTPRAIEDLEALLKGPFGPDTAVMIHGSADPQGGQELNARLSRQRADAIENFVRTKHGSLPIKNKKAAAEVGEPKSEPYQRVAEIQLVQPCR